MHLLSAEYLKEFATKFCSIHYLPRQNKEIQTGLERHEVYSRYPPDKHNKGCHIIWKQLYSLGHGILTQRVKYKHIDQMITCSSQEKYGQQVPFNLKLKAFSGEYLQHLMLVLLQFQNSQQSKEKRTHMMPSPPKDSQGTLSEKHTKDDFCAVTINEPSPPMMRYGIENQGATCYLNTVLQMLFMTEKFRTAVEGYVNNSECTIINHIARLFEDLKSGKGNTEGITTELKINVHKQEDAAKFLQKILQKIVKVAPEISKIFQGVMAQTTICINPEKEHNPLKQVKTFFILSISLNSEPSVHMQTCFDSYFAPIIMCGEDQQVYCKYCEMMMKTKIISSLQEVPSVLVLHLERFEFDYDTMCCVKNYSSVQIPPQLLVKEEAGVNHTYDLYAIANHSGSLDGGHYYTDIKDQNGWYRFNDSVVNRLENVPYDSDIHSHKAYLLLYKKSSVVSETESPGKHRKRPYTLPKDYPKPSKYRCSEHEIPQTNQLSKHICINTENQHDSQSTVSNEQNHMNKSDSDSETEGNTSRTTPDEPVPDSEMKSITIPIKINNYNHSTLNNSYGVKENQSSESELNNISEKGKDQQDLQVLQNESETEENTSETMPDEPLPDREIKSADADHNQPTPNNLSGVTESQSNERELNNTSENGKDLQVLQNNSDSDSEIEGNNADHNQPTPNNSSGEMDGQSSESESETDKNQQDLQVLLNNSESNSQNMPDEPVTKMQSNDVEEDNQFLLPSSAGQVSEQHKRSCESLENFSNDQKQSNANNNETKRAFMKYCIGISFLSVLVFLMLFIVSYFCAPHLLIFAVVVLLLSLICFLVLLAIFFVSYVIPTMFTTSRISHSTLV